MPIFVSRLIVSESGMLMIEEQTMIFETVNEQGTVEG